MHAILTQRQEAEAKPAVGRRYLALDAFRGFIMLILVSDGFGLIELAKRNPAFLGIAYQFDHSPWEWITFWDLIQPAFMFMVGVAMPFALARRLEQGATGSQLFRHVAARSFRLLLMSQILLSIHRNEFFFQVINVLAQIAITYFLCYLIMQLKFRWQVAVAALILIGYWAIFVMFPGAEGPFFSKTTNVGAVIDRFVFGRENLGFWVSINFITSTATTLFGVWTGQLLASHRSHAEKMRIMGLAGGRVSGSGAALPYLESDYQENLHDVLHDLQHRLGAAHAARILLGGGSEGLSQMDLPADGHRRKLHLHLFG